MKKLALRRIASHTAIFALYLLVCAGSVWGAHLVMDAHRLLRKSGVFGAISFWDSFAIAVLAFFVAILGFMVLGFWCVEFVVKRCESNKRFSP